MGPIAEVRSGIGVEGRWVQSLCVQGQPDGRLPSLTQANRPRQRNGLRVVGHADGLNVRGGRLIVHSDAMTAIGPRHGRSAPSPAQSDGCDVWTRRRRGGPGGRSAALD